jgi:hypothetical protein
MKRYALVLVALVLIATPAHAATKPVAVKKLDRIASAPGAEGLVIAGKNLVTFSNTSAPNTNVVVTGYDLNGIQVWQKTIDSGVDEIATTAAVDATGSIWIAGSSAPVTAPDTSTAPVITENPDGVVVEATLDRSRCGKSHQPVM